MTAKRDYYDILGIERNADAGAIKKAYRKLAKKYHPDTNAGNADTKKKFEEVGEAYAILSDPEKKKMYDQFGHAAFEAGAGAGSAYGENSYGRRAYTGGGNGWREYHFEGEDMDDLFGDLFGNIFHENKKQDSRAQTSHKSSFYSSGFDGGFSGSYPGKGEDLRADISVSFDEAALGCDKMITLQDPKVPGTRQSLSVHIPAGIDTGQSVRLRGKGMPGIGGGDPGDLLLKVKVETKPGYERKGLDVYTTVNIPYTTAVFGGEVRVHTLYGDVNCKIHEGTQSGSKVRLRGKGIVSMKNPAVHGDQYVTIQIQVPKKLTPEARKKLMEYKQVC
ncbi:J domain-containing protein [Muricomes intestini]|jgi:molecular chaperone DnaJ|uniref:J domain-containing protein n=1 Tax=Muricomes intestini TaxID=1796634 RepID=UPI002FE3DD20